MILGVTGLIGSGKSTVSDYISRKHGFEVIDYSHLLGQMLIKMGLEPTRENKRKLRSERGDDFLAEEVVKIMNLNSDKKYILTSLRKPEDVLIPKKFFPNMKLVVVNAGSMERFERTSNRERDRPLNWEHFISEDKKEEELFNFAETFKHADHIVDNNGSVENLYLQIDNLIKTLGN